MKSASSNAPCAPNPNPLISPGTYQARAKPFAAIAIIAFVHVLLRAILVPISHDEAVTFFLYIQRGEFLPHNMVWDANNHILNSALVYPLYRIFGADLIWLRLPNVLAFGVYTYYIFRLLSGLRSGFVFFLGALALMSAPLLLDFFAQTRGYGLGMAGFVAAIYYMSRYFATYQPRFQWLTWLSLVLGLLANMSMINSYLIALGFMALLIFVNFGFRKLKKHALPYLFGGILPFGALAFYAMAMRNRGLLYYGEKDGFVEVTVRTINKYMLYSDNMALAWVVAIIGLAAGMYLIANWLRRQFTNPDVGAIAAVFLLANALGAILLCHLLDVNYPEDRTGLYFIPLFLVVLTYRFDAVALKAPKHKYGALLLAAIPLLAIAGGNVGYTRLWRELHVHPELYEYVAEHHPNGKTLVEGYFLKATSWGYNTFLHDTKLSPLTPLRHAKGRADFAICFRQNCDALALTHDTVHKDPRNDTYLMQRREPLQWKAFHQAADLPSYAGNAEYFNFFVTEDRSSLDSLEALDLTFYIKSEARPFLCDVVISANDENGKQVYYDYMGLNWMAGAYDGDTLALRRMVHLPKGSTKLVCYLWNAKGVEYRVKFDEIGLLHAPAASSAAGKR